MLTVTVRFDSLKNAHIELKVEGPAGLTAEMCVPPPYENHFFLFDGERFGITIQGASLVVYQIHNIARIPV